MTENDKELQIVLLAAGKGTRMKSRLPKVLHQVCGVTLIERILRVVVELNPVKIIVVVGHEEELLREELEQVSKELELPDRSIELKIVTQKKQNGTGHAVQTALPALNDNSNVLIIPADVPLLTSQTLDRFSDDFNKQQATVSCLTCIHPAPYGYGRIIRDEKGVFRAIVEHKDCSENELLVSEINSSIYLVEISFLKQALKSLKANNAQGELYLTDIIAYADEHQFPTAAFIIDDYLEVSGANTRYELSLLEAHQRSLINKQHMLSGVTLEDSSQIYIDEDVVIGADTFIGAGTHLKGRTSIASDVEILGNSFIINTTIGSGAIIKPSCHITSATIAQNCSIGPFAHLRPGSKLHESVKIGNFCETKKVELHAGAKVNHLSYVGDAKVGKNTNIGAGTITCNYDGEKKHKTTISSDVFVGSNTSLVAPVTIGKGAVIGAGSTITKDVPDKALGIARAQQSNIDNWKNRKKS